jgi:hypothetical protein
MAVAIDEKKKTYGNSVCEAWVNQDSWAGKNYSKETIFFEGDTIYSYGYHFPMAKRIRTKNGYFYLVNGDRYSPTTDKHQSMLRGAVHDEKKIIVPFSALDSARINLDTIRLIDQENDKMIDGYYKDWETGERVATQRHLMGSSIFTAKKNNSRNIVVYTFIAGLDETGVNPWKSFFLAELPKNVSTVEEGYDALKPQEVLIAEKNNIEVKRQGEYFFVPLNDDVQKILNEIERHGEGFKNHCIEDLNGGSSDHKATRLIMGNNVQCAKGTVRHARKDHKMLKLGKQWHKVFHNTQVASWTVDGSID